MVYGVAFFFSDQDCRPPVLRRMYPLRPLLKPGKQDDILAVFSRFQRRTPGLLHRYILFSWARPPIFPTKRAIPLLRDGFLGAGRGGAKLTRSTRSASQIYGRACCESPFGLTGFPAWRDCWSPVPSRLIKIVGSVLRRMYPLRSLLKPGKQDDIFAVFSRFQRRTPGLLHRYILFSWARPPIFPPTKRMPSLSSGMAFWGLGGGEAQLTRSTRSACLAYGRTSCESPLGLTGLPAWLEGLPLARPPNGQTCCESLLDSQACRLGFFVSGCSFSYHL
ncbi:hypothetical protein PAEVO_40090 [Paenibacillus sp. GM2FR]|nr:hypothetical protein PAEVO_40090 [Paenibacillus sp. GM2FR]